MKNKSSMLNVIIIVLSIITIGLVGYITYDKLLNNNNQTNNTQNENKEEANANNTNTPSEEILKEIFKFTYDYLELPFVYCGETEGPLVEIYGTGRYMSKEFTTYEEVLNSLKKYMTIDVIVSKSPWAATTKEYYLEKDGNLYCEATYKGNIYSHNVIDLNITSSTNEKITFVGTMELKAPDFYELEIEYDKVEVTLEKNNNNWIVTSYQKQD